MPVECPANPQGTPHTYLEALGRSLAGIAPWLEQEPMDKEEREKRDRMIALVLASIDHGTSPDSPDFMDASQGTQPLVDAAFLAQGLLRAPRSVWNALPNRVQENVVRTLRATQIRKPHFSNWLLFSATIEAFLCRIGENWDRMRVDFALRQFEQWHCGDGAYSDGPQFQWDYYNSFVIHPMLVDVTSVVGSLDEDWKRLQDSIQRRTTRYAAVLERLIAPDGSYPCLGRSITYRCGAFHALAQAALRDTLPPELPACQVRGALDAVIRRTLKVPGTFDPQGWLRPGLCGYQPSLAELYISTGSLYLCLTAFLPLGLPETHPFWQGPDTPWTSCRAWSGQDLPRDHGMRE